MTLDKEDHRQLLLTALSAAPITGAMRDVERAVDAVRELREAIENAEVPEHPWSE